MENWLVCGWAAWYKYEYQQFNNNNNNNSLVWCAINNNVTEWNNQVLLLLWVYSLGLVDAQYFPYIYYMNAGIEMEEEQIEDKDNNIIK